MAEIRAANMPPRQVACRTNPGHRTRFLSERTRRIALVYAATAQANEQRDALADNPVITMSIK